MTDAVQAAVDQCVELVSRTLTTQRPLRILVLGDPSARLCRSAAAMGHRVQCCHDLQQYPGAGSLHVDVLCERATDLLGRALEIDLVIAVDGWARLLSTNTPGARTLIIEWMRQHASISLIEAPRRVLAPDLNDLGPFEVSAYLGDYRYLAEPVFVEGGGGLDTPLVLASDRWLLVEGEWIADDDIAWLGDPPKALQEKPVRTFRVPGDRIVKVECTSEDYFERTQVVGEWSFLDGAPDAMRVRLGLPRVHSLVRGRAVATLVRDDVVGGSGDDLPVAVRLAGIIDVTGRYAEAGVFHNDVRPWNVVWDGNCPRLVDFTDASLVDDDVRDLPQVLALAGTLAAIATAEIRGGEHFHLDVLAVAHRAGLVDRWPLQRQLGAPWDRVPNLRGMTKVAADLSAAAIMREVLAVTVG